MLKKVTTGDIGGGASKILAFLRWRHFLMTPYESYNVGFTLVQHQNLLIIFLNANIVLNLAGWCNITSFLNRSICFRAISFYYGYIFPLHFMPPSKSSIASRSHPTHYFKVNCKTNHLIVIDNVLYQSPGWTKEKRA